MTRAIPTDPAHAGHPVLPGCVGERCAICGHQAHHKVGEEFLDGQAALEPGGSERVLMRHNLTGYLCCGCFRVVMGGAGTSWCVPRK